MTSIAMVNRAGTDGEQVFTRLVLVVAYSAWAEALAETLKPGDLVTVQGKLGWRARLATKANPKPTGKIVGVGWEVERLTTALALQRKDVMHAPAARRQGSYVFDN